MELASANPAELPWRMPLLGSQASPILESRIMESGTALIPAGCEWNHTGKNWCFVLIQSGSGFFFLQGSAHEVRKGQLLVCPMGNRTSLRASLLGELNLHY